MISPVPLVVACVLTMVLCVVATDFLALPPKVRATARRPLSFGQHCTDLLVRGLIIFLVFAGFFCFSWRPLYATYATISFFVIFTLISRIKYRFIREPLIFSDIALVFSLLRDKELYHASWMGFVFWTLSLGYIFGGTGLYFYFEPSILPQSHQPLWILGGVLAAVLPWAALSLKGVIQPLSRFALAQMEDCLDITKNTARFGTFECVVLYLIVWLNIRRYAFLSKTPKASLKGLGEGLKIADDDRIPVIVVWQSESFYDLRHYGYTDLALPHLDALRARAARWGRVTSVFEGGYTLRTEFAVLTGLPPEDTPIDASHPYLHAGRYKRVAWPGRFRNADWRTVFIHPFKRRFFNRHKAMPKLGFETLLMLESFDPALLKDTPYVSDGDLTRRVLQEIEDRIKAAKTRRQVDQTEEKGLFVFVSSMANHGPWGPGRCQGLSDPQEVYIELLKRADAALGDLVQGLDQMDRPVWLLFYGDHAPLLKSLADPFPDPRMDYVMVPLGRSARKGNGETPPEAVEEAPWRLIETLVTLRAKNG